MVEPTSKCIDLVHNTGAELWADSKGSFFVVYPDSRTAHAHSRQVLDLLDIRDDDVFKAFAYSKSMIELLDDARRIL